MGVADHPRQPQSCGHGRVRGGHTCDLDTTNRKLFNRKNKLLGSGSLVKAPIQFTTLAPLTILTSKLDSACVVAEKGCVDRYRFWTLTCLVVKTDFLQPLLCLSEVFVLVFGRIEFTCKLKPAMCERVPRDLKRFYGREHILQAFWTLKETVCFMASPSFTTRSGLFSPLTSCTCCAGLVERKGDR